MPTTFESKDKPLSKILEEVHNGTDQLPDFQRGWVWDDERIKSLIASITCSYPVGALMFLQYGSKDIHFKYSAFTNTDVPESVCPENLVLDGQQRLTSLYCSLYCEKPVPTTPERDKNKKLKLFYYLDIAKCLSSSIDREDAVISVPEDKKLKTNFGKDVVLDLSTRENEYKNLMFPLNIIYKHNFSAATEWVNGCNEYYEYDKSIIKQNAAFQNTILLPINNYQIPVITLDKTTPKGAICRVFEKVNTGGVILTVFELVTASFAAESFQLKDDWEAIHEKFIDESSLSVQSQDETILKQVSSTDFLTAITLLSRYNKRLYENGEFVSCRKEDVLNLTLPEYQKYKEDVKFGFLQAAKFLKEQRIFTARDLPYSTQLIPLSVIFAILKSQAYDSIVKEKISQWYWCGVFGEMYGGANETRYANDVTGMMEWLKGGSAPDTVQRAYFQPTRLISLQTRLSAAYKGVMALILKAGCLDFITGSAMDFTVFIDENTDIHHIFPKDYCKSQGLNPKRWDSIINKTPLFSHTNRLIGGSAPSKYIAKIEDGKHVSSTKLDEYLASHLIDVSALRRDDFDDFLIERAKSLLTLISRAMGKPVQNLSGEDVVLEYGGPLE